MISIKMITNNITKPNFLIVGAAKSGTTSLVHYLSQHPDIFIPSRKELRYFVSHQIYSTNSNDPLLPRILEQSLLSKEDYYREFDVNFNWRGEASVHYLYHYGESIPKIKNELGDIPIFIILRNPVKRALSNYEYLYNIHKNSPEEEFEKESEYKDMNFNCFWYYKDLGLYSEQVQAFKNSFSNVYVYIFEDFIKDIHENMNSIFSNLNINPIDLQIEVQNQSNMKSGIGSFLNKVPFSYYLSRDIKRKLKEQFKSIFFKDKPNYSPNFLTELNDFYLNDIEKLEVILGKDLSIWKSN